MNRLDEMGQHDDDALYELDDRYNLSWIVYQWNVSGIKWSTSKIKLLKYKAANQIDLAWCACMNVIFMIMFLVLHQNIKSLNARLEYGDLKRYFGNARSDELKKTLTFVFGETKDWSVIIWVVCVILDLDWSPLCG